MAVIEAAYLWRGGRGGIPLEVVRRPQRARGAVTPGLSPPPHERETGEEQEPAPATDEESHPETSVARRSGPRCVLLLYGMACEARYGVSCPNDLRGPAARQIERAERLAGGGADGQARLAKGLLRQGVDEVVRHLLAESLGRLRQDVERGHALRLRRRRVQRDLAIAPCAASPADQARTAAAFSRMD